MSFTYPFRYVPSEAVKAAADDFINRLSKGIPFIGEGKMIGVLITDRGSLYSFSGTLGGKAEFPGFVPPVYDWTLPDGHFRRREAEISAMPQGNGKSEASAQLQEWLFRQYVVTNALGERKSVFDIFAEKGLVPPAGTGDCAAPKLLQYAYLNGLKPLSMGEFWYGRSPGREVREQGRFYPACTGKCGPLLTFMMKGLDVEPNPLDADYPVSGEPAILYKDEHYIIADKPSGMLSVPGRYNQGSLQEWLSERMGTVFSCHRLDMDTSGVIIYARSVEASSRMEALFSERKVEKTYRARLCEGEAWHHAPSGTIALPLMPDYYDRPRQMVDREHGKMAVTRYRFLEKLPDGEIDVEFVPLTGRTHQLRVHAAHPLGLGRPIKGDRLYGSPDAGRLFLDAESIKFTHPYTGLEIFISKRREA